MCGVNQIRSKRSRFRLVVVVVSRLYSGVIHVVRGGTCPSDFCDHRVSGIVHNTVQLWHLFNALRDPFWRTLPRLFAMVGHHVQHVC